MVAYLNRYAEKTPDAEAATDGAESLEWRQLKQHVDDVSDALVANGLCRGRRLAFFGPPGLQFWITLLASQRAGCVWVGLNPQYTCREITHVLSDARPALVIASTLVGPSAAEQLEQAIQASGGKPALHLPGECAALAPAIADFDGGSERRLESVDRELHQAGVALVVYTSGSTGAPKGALVRHVGLVENGWWLASQLGFSPHRTLVNLPVNHIGCVGDVCATALMLGGAIVFMQRFDAIAAVDVIRDQRIEWLPQVPAQFQMLVNKGGLDAAQAASVRSIMWGGAPMPRTLIEQLNGWGPKLFNSYGLTECSGTITVTRHDASIDEMADTVGVPVDRDLVRIVDEGLRPVDVGECGEIQIRGAHVFHGYLNNAAATCDVFTADGWLKTSDLGVFDVEGNIRLIGRTREMFKSGGYNVYPREIEVVLESLQAVELSAVVSKPDALWEEVGIAFVQGDPDALTHERLLNHCKDFLTAYKIPKQFVVTDALPLLPIGKVDKPRLSKEQIGPEEWSFCTFEQR